MKKHILLVIMLILMLCLALTGCAHKSSSAAASTGAPVQQGNQPETVPAEQTLNNQPEDTEQTQQTTSKPEAPETAKIPNQPDETGKYRHELESLAGYGGCAVPPYDKTGISYRETDGRVGDSGF